MPAPNDVESEEDKDVARDKTIQQTDGDASSSRMSAVALGYLYDEYAQAFTTGQIPRRYPIINRGTFVRTTAIDTLVNTFLADRSTVKKQIVSLGAGSDTRYFRLKNVKDLVYHEIDFAANTTSKIGTIQKTATLHDTVRSELKSASDLQLSSDSLYSPRFNIHPLDLRSLVSQSSSTLSTLTLPNLDPTVPTLLISECCLCYLDPATTSSVLSFFTGTLIPAPTPLAIIIYEPIRPYDSFGRTMVSNLASRGIHLQTLKKYYSLQAQRDRLRGAGFVSGQGARDVERIYYGEGAESWINPDERARIEGLEWLDEVEEWKLLARHYCVTWGWRDGEDDNNKVFGRAWTDIKGGWTEGERDDNEVG